MRAILSFGAIVSVLHLFEDAAMLLLGRYTEINIYILFVGTIIFGMLVAAVAKIPWVHRLWHSSEHKEHD